MTFATRHEQCDKGLATEILVKSVVCQCPKKSPRSIVNSEAVPLGRYVEQRLSNTLLNLYDVRIHRECHIPSKKEPKEGRVHLHLKHQQP